MVEPSQPPRLLDAVAISPTAIASEPNQTTVPVLPPTTPRFMSSLVGRGTVTVPSTAKRTTM